MWSATAAAAAAASAWPPRASARDRCRRVPRRGVAAWPLGDQGGAIPEDRIVKRFIQARSGNNPRGNRYQPEKENDIATFEKIGRKAISATKDEISSNPRARSAKLRLARRLNTISGEFSAFDIGLPKFNLGQLV